MLATAASADLKISDININSIGEKKEVKPNELVTIDFDLDNSGEEDLENTNALVYFLRSSKKMDDDEGNELEFSDFNIGTLRAGKTKNIKFSFNVPFDVSDGDSYIVHIEAEGKNESDKVKLKVTDESESFDIVESKHELLFYRLDISPKTISCASTLTIDLDVRNIGQRDEDNINLSIINNILGVKTSEGFSLAEGYDVDNRFEKTYTYDIPNTVPPGTYAINVNLLYNEGLSHVYNSTQITVQACGSAPATTTPSTTTPATTQPPATTTPSQTTYPASSAKPAAAEDNTMLYIIIGSEVLIAVIIVVLVLAWRRKK